VISTARRLTLIELLLVLFILSAVAASAASFVEKADDQLRYDDTKQRVRALRSAVLGEASGELRDRRAGFVADMGRLPASLSELLERGALPAYALDPPGLLGAAPPTGLGFGWRGSYLASLPRADGTQAYPDGWSNPALAADPPGSSGWAWQADDAAGSLVARSRGRGGQDDGATPPADLYARDYPAGDLVLSDDHRLDLHGWRVQVRVDGSAALRTVRLRLRYFAYEAGVATQVALVSQAIPVPAGNVDPLEAHFDFGGQRFVPWGAKALDLVDEPAASPAAADLIYLGPGNGPVFAPSAGSSPQRVELFPRATLPTALPLRWKLP
jgi:type II secretory pathway pseudopilin PulG